MAEPKVNELMEKIVSLCKRRGFIFQSSEIYGGINGFWDYGPLGAELKRNVKDLWWRSMVHERDDVMGLEATIIMHPQIWRASGHVETFSDPMCDCLLTGKRFRADQIEPQSGDAYHYSGADPGEVVPRLALAKLETEIQSLLANDPSDIRGEAEALWQATEKSLSGLRSVEASLSAGGQEAKPIRELIRDFLKRFDRGSDDVFAVLIPSGKHPEYARKVARQFYSLRGVNDPKLRDERVEKVMNSTRFNPDNGALLTEARPFNLMFKTYVGPLESEENVAYLRPETAQAIFAQFKNVLETSRQKVPFGIAQMGKAFRNEVTPRNFTFRSREFEQMELEFFIRPDEAVEAISGRIAAAGEATQDSRPKTQDTSSWGWEAWHKYWVEERIRFYESIGLPRTSLEEYWQKPEELAHYAKATVDILYKFPFGTQELEGIAARGDFDLSQHQRCSGKSMEYFDEEAKNAWAKLDDEKRRALQDRFLESKRGDFAKRGYKPEEIEAKAKEAAERLGKGNYVPHVIEPSAGVDRLVLALICNAYTEDQAPDEKGKLETRVVMKFHPRVAPIKAAIFPLLKNRPELVQKALEVRDLLRAHMTVFYDDTGAIGRRYRRQDEAGTPFGITIDFDTLGEKPELKDTVTLRDRDSMKQERVAIRDLLPRLLEKIR